MLAQPDFDKQFYILVDASSIGIASYLGQGKVEDQDILQCASRVLKEVERRYFVIDREYVAVVYIVEKNPSF